MRSPDSGLFSPRTLRLFQKAVNHKKMAEISHRVEYVGKKCGEIYFRKNRKYREVYTNTNMMPEKEDQR